MVNNLWARAIAGVVSSLASGASAAWSLNPNAPDATADAGLEFYSKYTAPGTTTAHENGAFQAIRTTGTTNFSMAGGVENGIEVGGFFEEYVVLMAEAHAVSLINPFYSSDASADIDITVDPNFKVQAWVG